MQLNSPALCCLRMPSMRPSSVNVGLCYSDGWSMGVMYRELAAVYNAMRAGCPQPAFPALPIQYADFSTWQHTRLKNGELDIQRAYWKQYLADAPQLLELPTDFPRPSTFSGRGASVPVDLPASLVKGLRSLAASCGATTFMALLAVWQVRAMYIWLDISSMW